MARLTKPIDGIETKTVSQIFGSTVKQLRENQNMTRGRFSEITGLTSQSIKSIEAGSNKTTLEFAERYAHGLGVELYELL